MYDNSCSQPKLHGTLLQTHFKVLYLSFWKPQSCMYCSKSTFADTDHVVQITTPVHTSWSLCDLVPSTPNDWIHLPRSVFYFRPNRQTKQLVYDPQVGMDYTMLRQHLAEGDFRKADDETRALLIRLAGEGSVKRNWVYFSEVSHQMG